MHLAPKDEHLFGGNLFPQGELLGVQQLSKHRQFVQLVNCLPSCTLRQHSLDFVQETCDLAFFSSYVLYQTNGW